MNAGALARHDVSCVREFQPVPRVLAEKGKVLQILVNLIRNAKYATDEGGTTEKIITLRIEPGRPGRVRLIVQDNGIGIPAGEPGEDFQPWFHHAQRRPWLRAAFVDHRREGNEGQPDGAQRRHWQGRNVYAGAAGGTGQRVWRVAEISRQRLPLSSTAQLSARESRE